MAWDNAVVTNAGLALYTQALLDGGITITGAQGGYSTVPAVSLLNQTTITGPGMDVPIAKVSKIDAGLEVVLRINNIGLEVGYTLKMFGIFAQNKNGDVALLAVIQDPDGERVPSEQENPEYVFEFGLVLPLTNMERVDMTINPTILVTKQELQAAVDALAHQTENRIFISASSSAMPSEGWRFWLRDGGELPGYDDLPTPEPGGDAFGVPIALQTGPPGSSGDVTLMDDDGTAEVVLNIRNADSETEDYDDYIVE